MVHPHNLLDHALAYLRRGWSVIPTKGKRAAGAWKRYQTQLPSEAELRRWFSNGKASGIAVILGNASGGLGCRDFDVAEAYHCWANAHPDLAAKLPTVKTARGFHVYFRSAAEEYSDLGNGEYRADHKHYCLLPPSRHPSGSVYRWSVPLRDELLLLDPAEAELRPPTHILLCPESSVCSVSSVSDCANAAIAKPEGLRPPTHILLCPESSVCSVSDCEGENDLENAILQTLPLRQGERARRLFDFARALKGMPQYADADGAALEPLVREWHRQAYPVIGTKPFEESLIDFLKAWSKVKYPAGAGPLDALLRKARRTALPPCGQRYEQAEMQLLVKLLAEMQRVAGDKPFFLSCRSAAKVLGVSHDTTARWLFLLVTQGVLALVTKGERSRRRAAEYLYLA